MLSVVITANKIVDNVYERNQEIVKMLIASKVEYDITYVCTEDYGDRQALSTLVQDMPSHGLIVMDKDSNINTQVYAGLSKANGNEVLLLTIDTNLDLIEEILQKREDGYESIVVQKKSKGILSIITSIGVGTYAFGQACMGKLKDMCNDSNIALLTPETVNEITFDASMCKESRITNRQPDKTHIMLKRATLYDTPTPLEQKPMKSLTALGWASTLYYAALLCMMVVFPFFNSGVYTWWMILSIVLWIALGVFSSVIVAKDNSTTRLKNGVPLDLAGNAIMKVVSFTEFGNGTKVFQNTEKEQAEDVVAEQNNIVPTTAEDTTTQLSADIVAKANKKEKTKAIKEPENNKEETESKIQKRGRPKKQVSADAPKRPRGRPKKEIVESDEPKRARGRPRKEKVESDTPKRPRGRPKKPVVESEAPKRPRGRPKKEIN
ncbi:MAG: hypothetical protein IKC79_01345 [Clostridia bacterium]|nr:hypothetical protein [Clostridia bacterium]